MPNTQQKSSRPVIIPAGAQFGIELDYQPNTDSPSRIFRTMSDLIESFEEIDKILVTSISSHIKPVLLLENIEAGSLRSWMAEILESVDDDAIKSLDWKKFVGSYLVKAKHVMVDFLNGKTTISSSTEIDELQNSLLETAIETDVLGIPTYTAITPVRISKCLGMLTEATQPLQEGDSAKYMSAQGTSEFNLSFKVAPESLEEILTREKLTNTDQVILRVKKPDFLGESMWEFKLESKTIEAKILDHEWLRKFRNRSVELRPGDSIKAALKSIVRYGSDWEVIASSYEVLKVEKILEAEVTSQIPLM